MFCKEADDFFFWQQTVIQSWSVINSMLIYPILGGGNSNIFICSPLPGEMIQFDKHIFQMGWFNHQTRRQTQLCEIGWLVPFSTIDMTSFAHGPFPPRWCCERGKKLLRHTWTRCGNSLRRPRVTLCCKSKRPFEIHMNSYCWWTKSCTTWDG